MLGKEVLDGDARFAFDETKVTLDISGLGVTGYAAEDWLTENGQISMGLSDDVHLLACFTLGNIDAEAEALVVAIRALADWASTQKGKGRPPGMPRRRDLPTTMAMTPAEAFFGRTEAVPLERAASPPRWSRPTRPASRAWCPASGSRRLRMWWDACSPGSL